MKLSFFISLVWVWSIIGNNSLCAETAEHIKLIKTNRAILSASTRNLALSVQGLNLNEFPSGQPRQIIIRNIGVVPAIGLSINYPQWPSGTWISSSESTCIQDGVLEAGASCKIIIVPGAIATSGANSRSCTKGSAPVPGVVSVTANNSNLISIHVVVLGYACIYKGGFIYAMTETTDPSKSIAGTVLSLQDQAPIYPNGIIWSSNGNGSTESDVSYVSILGIDTLSIPTNPSPTAPSYPLGTPSFLPCNGNLDGSCNTKNIVSYYNYNRTHGGSSPTPLMLYAAGLCSNYTVDSLENSPCKTGTCYNNWYLPAICEMGPDTDGSGCILGSQNIADNLPGLVGDSEGVSPGIPCVLGSHCLAGDYWSSSEFSVNPRHSAWYESFASNNTFQFNTIKSIPLGVRCSRTF